MSHAIARNVAGANTRLVGCRDVVDIKANVIRSAHDAGLVRLGEAAAAVLHHTLVAHLMRQGARFGGLSRWVGRLPREAFDACGALALDGAKQPAQRINPVLSALRRCSAVA